MIPSSIKEYTAKIILPSQGLGSTQGALAVILKNEPIQAVIKPQYSPDKLRIGPNELIVNLLGSLIDAPVLEPLFVTLREGHYNEESMGMPPPLLGRCFGTRYMANTFDGNAVYSNEERLNTLSNPEQAIPILLLDAWVNGYDHAYDNNLLFVPNSDRKNRRGLTLKMYTIDYGLAFTAYNSSHTVWGEEWTVDSLKIGQYNEIAIDSTAQLLIKLARLHRSYLENYLKKVEIVDKKDLRNIMNLLPMEWGVSEAEKIALLEFLLERQKYLRPYFNNFL